MSAGCSSGISYINIYATIVKIISVDKGMNMWISTQQNAES